MSTHTSKQSALCFFSLFQRRLLCHSDVCIEMSGFLDAIQTLPTELCWGDSSLPECLRHLENANQTGVVGCDSVLSRELAPSQHFHVSK